MKIAIVGTGISGLVAAHRLHREHEIVVYEASERIGGHTHTVPVEAADGTHWIDTGFIVFNDRNYPSSKRCWRSWGSRASPPTWASPSPTARPLRVLRHPVGPLRPPRAPVQPGLPRHAPRLAPLQPRGAGADRDERDRALARPLARAAGLLSPLRRAADRAAGERRLVSRPGADVELPGQLHGRVLREPRHVQPAGPAAMADRERRLAQLRGGHHRAVARPGAAAGAGAADRAAARTACGSRPRAARARTSTRS